MSATFQPDGAPPAKSSSTTKVVLIVLAVLVLLGLLACGGVVGLMYFGFDQFQELAGEEYKKQLVGNSVIEEELGEIQSMKLDFPASTSRAQENPGKQVLVFDVDGSRADGTVVAEMASGGGTRIASATLETEDGRTVEIPLQTMEEQPLEVREPVDAEVSEEPIAPTP